MIFFLLFIPNQDLEHKIISLVKKELKRFKKLLSADYPACSEREVEDEEDQSSSREGVLKITLNMLRNMEQTKLANMLQSSKSCFIISLLSPWSLSTPALHLLCFNCSQHT